MSPSQIRRILGKRRAWILARLEREQGRTRSYLEHELEALNSVLQMLEAVSGHASQVVQARDQYAFERAREQLSQPRCTCERCPIHGAKQ